MLTLDEVKAAMPTNCKNAVTQEFLDKVNDVINDPDTSSEFRDNFLTFSHVVKEGRYNLQDYLNAVRFVSLRQMGLKVKEAYAKTFPDRMLNFAAMGKSEKDISAHMSAFNKNKMVTMLYEQSAIEPWMLYQDAFAQGVRTLVNVCRTSTNDMARASAANSLLVNLKRPEAAKIKVDVTTNDGGVGALQDLLVQIAAEQQKAIASGAMSAQAVAHMPLVIEHDDSK